MISFNGWKTICCAALVAACSKTSAEPREVVAAAALPATASAPTPVGSASTLARMGSDAAWSQLSLAERIELERGNRPTDTPTAEKVFGALEKAGISLAVARQHAGYPIGAQYCAGTSTAGGVAMSVCEYTDEAAAEKGRAVSSKAFAKIPNREIFVNKKTTLTVMQAGITEKSAHEAKRAKALFSAM